MYIRRHGVQFEWDDRKARSNLRKHGIDLPDAADIFAGLVLVAPDERFDYGENRWIGIGEVQGRTVVVAFAEREGGARIRLISARKALTHERQIYEKALQDALESSRPPARR